MWYLTANCYLKGQTVDKSNRPHLFALSLHRDDLFLCLVVWLVSFTTTIVAASWNKHLKLHACTSVTARQYNCWRELFCGNFFSYHQRSCVHRCLLRCPIVHYNQSSSPFNPASNIQRTGLNSEDQASQQTFAKYLVFGILFNSWMSIIRQRPGECGETSSFLTLSFVPLALRLWCW